MFWYILRLIIGIGDHALHFSTQTWITSFSPQHRLGRNIAIYGLSFGAGFAAGPLFVPLVNIFEGFHLSFQVFCACLHGRLFFLLKNDFPDVIKGKSAEARFFNVLKRRLLLHGWHFSVHLAMVFLNPP